MVKRIVDTNFWTSMDVIDNYSVEDKFFALYLMTNDKTTQVGIYSLPKRIISFETGFTTDVIQVLLERFSKKYGQILYSETTQEIALLHSLKYSIMKGGKPVSDLLERELRRIQDGQLILATYQMMKEFWKTSSRKFDQTIQKIFESELINRELIVPENDNEYQNDNEKENDNDNKNDNDNDNEESYSTNRSTESYRTNRNPEESSNRLLKDPANRNPNLPTLINKDNLMPEEQYYLSNYLESLHFKNPSFTQAVKSNEILDVFYSELLGEVTPEVKEKIELWDKALPKSLILEAFVRSVDKYKPLSYVDKIIKNWVKADVKNMRDLSRLDRKFNLNKK